ncbi:MAG: arginine--tRNA ligase [Candidatus Calescibacterium sp.]|nr:arginine--tRNA ligase [Candidatus Calescibacterium sp.]MCX7972318.1 arginine--tRNA ligase [bacterium]MDW8195078.1 arginine--tRNA ligase [Candidatus Calescibacterium sp.]
MYSLKEYLSNRLRSYLGKENIFIDVSRSPIKGFDYSTNLLHVVKGLNENELVQYLREDEIIDNVEIINRFVNIRLNRKIVFRKILDNFASDEWRGYDLGKGKKVLIEFVSANPTGPLNAVNGRSATFGSVLSNVLKYFNYQVYKEYYVNDVGEQVEKLVDSFIERLKQVRGQEYQIPEGGYHGEYLKDLAEKFLNSSNYTQEREKIKQFLISYFVEEHKNTLYNFGVVFDNWFKQSSLTSLESTLKYLSEKGFLYEDDGAIYFTSTAFGDDKDRVVKKTRGRVDYTYFAYDIEYIKNKFERGFDQIITILGPDHHGYVNRLMAATKALGYSDHKIIILQIVNILEKDRALRMSKRKGVMVLLDELINKVKPEFLRYFFISRLKDSPLDLDLELINRMTLDNPLYYIFYVYARINGIIRNYSKTLPALASEVDSDIDDEEFGLFLSAQEFRDSVLSAINDPYYLTLWAHNFAKSFHRFYNSNKVICADELGIEKEKLRMIIILFSKGVLERWAELLNIELPEKM